MLIGRHPLRFLVFFASPLTHAQLQVKDRQNGDGQDKQNVGLSGFSISGNGAR